MSPNFRAALVFAANGFIIISTNISRPAVGGSITKPEQCFSSITKFYNDKIVVYFLFFSHHLVFGIVLNEFVLLDDVSIPSLRQSREIAPEG